MKRNKLRIIKIILVLAIVFLGSVLVGTQIMEAKHRPKGGYGYAKAPDAKSDVITNTYDKKAKPAFKTKLGEITDLNAEQERKEAEKGKLSKPGDYDEKKEDKTETGAQTTTGAVAWNDGWKYAGFSKIHSGSGMMYKSSASNRRGIVVAINAGHGTAGGTSVYTQCHPDGSPKVTGGSTGAGATQAMAVSSGTTLNNGMSEAQAVLAVARAAKDSLLAAGYDVLMLRDGDDVQLDNVARTVMANNNASCHISIHYDSSSSDKGLFYTSVPNVGSYRSMEPVASHWQEHNALGESMLTGMRSAGVKIYGSGSMAIDLTQTSYSTIPSIDLEVGDRASDTSGATVSALAKGIVAGVSDYF